jgi:hypothetical protein
MDTDPYPLTYYRLKQLDIGGSFEYSKVISVTNNTIKTDLISVYPIPTKDEINLKFYSTVNSNQELIISDLTGRILETKTLSAEKGENHHVINLRNYLPGLYFLNLRSNGTNYYVKIAKN